MLQQKIIMKFKFSIFLFFLFISSLHASKWHAEVRAGYFYPTSKTFRNIYENGGAEVEGEVAYSFNVNWMIWGNVNYFQRRGRSIGFQDKTTIYMVPISLGFKYRFQFNRPLLPYLGGGATYTFLNIKNHSDFVKRNVTKSGFGFVVKAGIYIYLPRNFYLDPFIDYYYQRVNFHAKRNVDVGGLRIGSGFGYRF